MGGSVGGALAGVLAFLGWILISRGDVSLGVAVGSVGLVGGLVWALVGGGYGGGYGGDGNDDV